MHPAMNQLSQLPVSERLELVEQLWDSIAESREQLPIQEWHRELVKARLADPEIALTREELWRRVESENGQ